MAENLTLEQRAEALAAEYYGPGYEANHLRAMVASAIRSAVEAETSRCSGIIDAWPADASCVPADEYELMDRDVAMIAAIRSPSQEAANNG